MRHAYPDRSVSHFTPDAVVFSRVTGREKTELQPLDRASALKALLEQSGPQLFDKGTMPQHLAVLHRMVHQCTRYKMEAGLDLYQDPTLLLPLLAAADEQGHGPDHRRTHQSL